MQIWQILVGSAFRRELLTYSDVAERCGHNSKRVLAKQLGRIMYYCSQNKLPPLTALVVGKTAGKPGRGLAYAGDLDRHRERVFATRWYLIYPPTAEELRAAWDGE
ncbi:MAG: hypothetical protein DYH12_34885 [Sorangiineae bacterium PRO1]|nr:hypothetical protein [Sorangiineae bacterium PRO1]